MPVRVRCPDCEKVLKLPDAARGKVAKCSGCGGRVRVPKGSSGKTGKKRARPQAPAHAGEPDDDFLSGLDLRHAEDMDTPLCPKCAAEVDEEDIECPVCGVDLATGVLSEKQRYLRARKGPDSDLFYREAWSDSWEFLLENWRLVVQTFLIWSVCTTANFAAVWTQNWCVIREYNQRKTIQDELPPVTKDGKQVQPKKLTSAELLVKARTSPPAVFWGFVSMIIGLTTNGWYWLAAMHVVTATMERKTLKKIPFDFFANAALGVKGYVWPIVLILPVVWLPPLAILPLLVFPIALVHMTQKYSYQAYLPVHMGRIFLRIPGATLYVLMIAIVVHLIVLIALGVAVGLMGPKLVSLFMQNSGQLAEWFNGVAFGFDPNGFMHFVMVELPAVVVVTSAATVPLALLMSIPAVYTMRVIGLFGYYFRPELGLDVEHPANQPCGFWVRWLAYLIDAVVITCLVGVASGLVLGFSSFLQGFGVELPALFMGLLGLITVVFPFLYFVTSQCGLGQATLGKRALGVIVTDLKGEPITFGRAAGRYLSKIISAIPLLAGFFMAAFTEKKQALHDQISKTLVVWQEEEGRS